MSDDEPPKDEIKNKPLPSVTELKSTVKTTSNLESSERQERFEQEFTSASIDNEKRYTHVRGLGDHYKHKGYWSLFLMFIMLLMLTFQCVLLGLVGAKIWDYKEYTWLLPALLVQNLAQIVGLAVFVVKSLFKDVEDKQVAETPLK